MAMLMINFQEHFLKAKKKKKTGCSSSNHTQTNTNASNVFLHKKKKCAEQEWYCDADDNNDDNMANRKWYFTILP